MPNASGSSVAPLAGLGVLTARVPCAGDAVASARGHADHAIAAGALPASLQPILSDGVRAAEAVAAALRTAGVPLAMMDQLLAGDGLHRASSADALATAQRLLITTVFAGDLGAGL